jgi:hypothetical protein
MMNRLWALALSLGLAGCKVTSEPWCMEIEYGDCRGAANSAPAADSLRVVGLPANHLVNGTATMLVGESITLYLIHAATGDTLHNVAWGTSPTSSAVAVAQGTNGTGVLRGIAAGYVYSVQTNGVARPISWCDHGCANLIVRVVAP